MEKVCIVGQIKVLTLGTLMETKFKATVFASGTMAGSMMGSGQTTKCKVKARLLFPTVMSTLETLLTTQSMVKA